MLRWVKFDKDLLMKKCIVMKNFEILQNGKGNHKRISKKSIIAMNSKCDFNKFITFFSYSLSLKVDIFLVNQYAICILAYSIFHFLNSKYSNHKVNDLKSCNLQEDIFFNLHVSK